MTKLHLGCGRRYLDGYINIDYPPTEHSVQSEIKVDQYADILKLWYPKNSVHEIRLHHVFEHFPRQIALGLLCRWNDWLVPGGKLWIETPDIMASARALVSPFASESTRSQILRHIFGSHESHWAAHWDGWYKSRFAQTLSAFGYCRIEFIRSSWEALFNIEVRAYRGCRTFDLEEYRQIVQKLLQQSLVTHKTRESKFNVSESEIRMLEVWMKEWEALYLARDDVYGPTESGTD